MNPPPAYASLWCKTNFSFLEGASHPEELIEEAAHHGVRSLAVTDRDGVYGIVRAFTRARALDVHLITGAQVTTEDGSHILLLAADRTGYTNLCRLLTAGRMRCPKGESVVHWREVCEHAGNLIALWGGEGSLVSAQADPLFVARDLREAFGDRLYILLARHLRATDARIEHRVRERATRYGAPTVAATEVLYHTRARRRLHDILTCIRHGVTLPAAGRLTRPNAEHDLKSPYRFGLLWEDDPASVARTLDVAARCTFSLSDIRYRYPSERLPDGLTSAQWLATLTREGAHERYPAERYPGGIPREVSAQIEKELRIIHDLEYDGYFLTMYEIVQFCRARGILCQGRGSAANSAACYCLGITAVDPTQTDLLFERFLSKERAEPPDIDLDIEHERREEVIQWVYAKYGRTHAAMAANVVRYRARSAVRDVGKALGVPDTTLDRIARLLSHYGGVTANALREAGFNPDTPAHRHLAELSADIQDFPRHLSIHPGGFVLGHEPVCGLVPVENATMEDRTVIQWDKDDLEAIGLFKVDLLGLGMLTVLSRAFALIEQHYGKHLSMAAIPYDDEPTFEMIRRADTVGVFQIESRAQMAMLPRLKPRTWYDLVIEISIVRPGPITGGMVHPYLRRRSGEEPVVYPHPSLEPVLRKTLGIPLFQEQVMKLAVVAADYTPGEADQLRRDMAAWRRSGQLERHRDKLIRRMMARGIEREFAERVFEQIRGFGDYGFPESHAASFAHIAYVSAWLKRHYPDVFTCALLASQPMGFYAPATLIDDAKRHGVRVLPVDVNASAWECTLERAGETLDELGRRRPADPGLSRLAIRLGLRMVRGLSHDTGQRIVAARGNTACNNGYSNVPPITMRAGHAPASSEAVPFGSIDEFAHRTGCDDGTMERLASAGAFASLDPSRRRALWRALGVSRPRTTHTDARTLPIPPPAGTAPFPSLGQFETIAWDYDATGASPRGHPLEPMRGALTALGLPTAAAVTHLPHGTRTRFAGLVITRQRPSTAGGVVFLTLEDETGFVNVVLWQKVYERHRVLAKTASFLGVSGKIQNEEGVVHVVATSLWPPQTARKPRRRRSRNFR